MQVLSQHSTSSFGVPGRPATNENIVATRMQRKAITVSSNNHSSNNGSCNDTVVGLSILLPAITIF